MPLLTLGIPSSGTSAVLLGAFILFGIQPGPLLIEEQPELVWGLLASFYIGNVILLLMNLPLAPLFASMLRLRYELMYPLILLLSFVGAYAIENRLWGVWLAFAFGVIGYFMARFGYPAAPVILGVILGGLMEQALLRTQSIGGGSFAIFLDRPIALAIFALAVFIVAGPLLFKARRRLRARRATREPHHRKDPRMTLALTGMRVLDLTQVMAGPFCCQLLGDLGADVVKVEPPGVGDQSRRSMGFSMKGEDTAAYLAVNRNKRSVELNLKHDASRAAFHRLAETADVVVENFRPGVTKRLGVDYETLRERNRGLIYASISGFGQTGPYAMRPGFDLIAQGMSGVMSVTGEPGGDPVKCGIPIGDLSAGLFCAVGILSAYVARARTGEGQYIDTSLVEGALALSIWESAELWATGNVPQAFGSAHRLTAPYQALRTKDGHVTVGGNNTRLWTRLCEAVGRPELVDDERFATNADRMANRAELAAELESALAARTTAEWVEALLEAGVPAGPINDYAQVFDDPHIRRARWSWRWSTRWRARSRVSASP